MTARSWTLWITCGIALELTPQDADTTIKELKPRHFNLIRLTMTQLCSLAKRIAGKVRQDSDDLYQFTRKSVLNFLCDAVETNRLEIDSLEENVKRDVTKELNKRRR